MTSLGMFAHTWGWAIPVAPLTVIVTVGSVVERPTVEDGLVVARPRLPLTVSFDHAVVDGAPAARFVDTLRDLVETAAALDDLPADPSADLTSRAPRTRQLDTTSTEAGGQAARARRAP